MKSKHSAVQKSLAQLAIIVRPRSLSSRSLTIRHVLVDQQMTDMYTTVKRQFHGQIVFFGFGF